MAYTEQASWLIGPTAALDTAGLRGCYRYASSATAASAALPLGWTTARTNLGRYGSGPFIRIAARTVAVQVAFSKGAAVTLVINQLSSIGTGHAQAGFTVEAGTFVDVMVPSDCSHINWVGPDTTGWVEFYMSEGGRSAAES
jgi:hypothetical protein